MKRNRSFSLVEVILAIAIFVILAVSGMTLVLHSFSVNKLGEEQTNAGLYAQEGIEGVRSIKDQYWSNLVADAETKGLWYSNGYWEFNGTNDTKDKYTRIILVSAVNRDGNGNIVESGGTLDANTMKVTSTVNWNFSTARNNSITHITYLTNFRKPIVEDALVIYGDTSNTPKYRLFNSYSNSFGAQLNTVSGSSGQYFSVRTSPRKIEAIAGYVSSSGVLQVMCFNGLSWTNEWSVSVGGGGTTKRFDIAYETSSGDVVVVYSQNTTSANALVYRTKAGSSGCGLVNWTSAVNFATNPSATTGTVQWVSLARDPRTASNNITAIWADDSSDLGVNNWSGSTWATGTGTYKALETDLERVNTSQDVDNFGVVYESVSGNAMVVWGNASGANGVNGARYSRCTGGVYTCSWSTASPIPTVNDDVHNIDVSANPNTNQIAYAAIGDAGNDLTAGYWSGSAWTGYRNLDASAESPFPGSKLVSTAWLINGLTTRWVLSYDDATGQNLSWFAATPGSVPVMQADFDVVPNVGDIRERYDSDFNPVAKNEAMVVFTNASRLLFAKRILMDTSGNFTWNNSDGSAALGTTAIIPQQGFAFAYWRNP